MRFFVESLTERRPIDVAIDRLVIAGWTGRDRQAMEHHIQELEALGVRRPPHTPVFYRVAAPRLAPCGALQTPGGASSGEVEFMLVQHQGELFVGVASDHTDREVETYGITVSKQMCDKPCADTLWPWREVRPHWDQLRLHSRIREDGRMQAYQSGSVAALLDPESLLAQLQRFDPWSDGSAVLGGTLPAMGGVRPSDRFEFELEDPVLKRRLAGGYEVVPLPMRG